MRGSIACRRPMKGFSRQLLISMVVLSTASLSVTQKLIAQEITTAPNTSNLIKGRVTGEDGKPMRGVSVQLKGASGGTLTGLNGEYQLNVHSKASSVLIFTYVGMEHQEVPVGNK